MLPPVNVASPPAKPLLIFDGDCGFCRRWVGRWQRAVGDAVDYLPFQDEAIKARFPEIPRQDLAEAIHFILPDGRVYRGADAAFRSLGEGGVERWMEWSYQHVPLFATISEFLYRQVASHRTFLSRLDRIFLGAEVTPPRHVAVRWLFLRGLALIYLIAFVSLRVQMDGLIGSQGIVPAQAVMERAQSAVASQHIGLARYHFVPTLAWWGASDSALHWQCNLGIISSILVLLGVTPSFLLFLLWLLYLSLSTVASPFLNFQWDTLLLETGFLAIFFAPLCWLEKPTRQPPPSRLALWLLRWLIFRLMFESGVVKLTSGDETWTQLTALRVHYETQPLPTWIGWYAHQLPHAAQSVSTVAMFAIELVLPFLIFPGRVPRAVAALGFFLLQIVILLTGNYTFFNWLTVLLCLPLLDDRLLSRGRDMLHRVANFGRKENATVAASQPTPLPHSTMARWPWKLMLPISVFVVLMTGVTLPWPEAVVKKFPSSLLSACDWFEPFRTFNSYGLFRVMTQTRPEIIVQGSNDGQTWEDYEFKYKPGDLKRPPAFVAPHQPRLDWQMWFAALGSVEQNQWFLLFEKRLLENSQPVTALLEYNPFPQSPPKYIRAQLYEYHFTDPATRRATGDWWRRDYEGLYAPPLTLQDFRPRQKE